VSGHFEVSSSPDGGYMFRLKDAHGNTWATSGRFSTKHAAAQAIALVREIAGTGLVRDHSAGHHGEPLPPRIRPAQTAVRSGSNLRSPGHTRFPSHRRARAGT
jgi:uncharacterized protein YegP (UPF0339 family)